MNKQNKLASLIMNWWTNLKQRLFFAKNRNLFNLEKKMSKNGWLTSFFRPGVFLPAIMGLILLTVGALYWGYHTFQRNITLPPPGPFELPYNSYRDGGMVESEPVPPTALEELPTDATSAPQPANNGEKNAAPDQPSPKVAETANPEKTVAAKKPAPPQPQTKPSANGPAPVEPAKPAMAGQANALQLSLPLPGRITIPFGLQNSKTLKSWKQHNGIDLFAAKGEAVKAATDGVVKEINNTYNLGTVVVVDCGNGLEVWYGNLAEKVPVKVGQSLATGDLIGQVGDTANYEIADDPHLHFEVRRDGKPIDPAPYLK